MKSDLDVAMPLIGILLVAVGAIGLYILAYVVGQMGGSVTPWILVGLCLVPAAFYVIWDVSKIPFKKRRQAAAAATKPVAAPAE